MMITNLGTVHVGAPPPRQPTDWVIAPVHFNGFAGLTTTEAEPVRSPEFSCFGHQWTVAIYPGGLSSSPDGHVHVALFLQNRTETAIEVEYKLTIKHPDGGEDISKSSGELMKFSPAGSWLGLGADARPNHGCNDFALRSTLLNYLVDGTLIVEAHMTTNKPGQQSAPFKPGNPVLQNMLKDFGNEETADVEFEVLVTTTPASTTTFHAHHYPLQLSAPALADMCRPGDGSAPTTINNVQPEVFKHLLYYCYGGKIDEEDLRSSATDIIEAADRFGIVNLKLEAEACYVDMVELTLDSIAEVVAYADSKNLALLKEHCMEFLSSANKMEVVEKVSFANMPPHLMKDLMVALARSVASSDKTGDLEMISVSELREMAHKKGLNVDGSREMLIASLKGDEVNTEVE